MIVLGKSPIQEANIAAFAIFTSLILVALSVLTLDHFLHASVIPCTDTWSNHLILSLTLALVLQMFLAPRILPRHHKPFLAIHAVLILLTLWFGLYSISPLGYSTGRIPNLRAFLIVRPNRTSLIENNEIISVPSGSNVGISPRMLPGKFHCDWMSIAGGALDDTSSCDTVYSPPAADHDILRLRIQSSCGLPDARGQIRVSILP